MADQKWCTACKSLHPAGNFGRDSSRGDGLAACCLASRRVKVRAVRRKTGPRGWIAPTRAGDKKQARRRVNYLVEQGRLANPNTVPCADCGHIGSGPRHEYDHHSGYGPAHQLDVQAVCSSCHHTREATRRAA